MSLRYLSVFFKSLCNFLQNLMKRAVWVINYAILFLQSLKITHFHMDTFRKLIISFLLANWLRNWISIYIFCIVEDTLSNSIWKKIFSYHCHVPLVIRLQKMRWFINRSCYFSPQAPQKITLHSSTCNDIIEETFSFNRIINFNV